ncbi:FadR/GntR family transcriptional regulator [Bacillus sp. FJAT-47783]|uniref:FadR/GntR family transcriptional regulator n=1 Tax=Bacillus sp. FJAT-47783 TaxID=2922712 RepID=UPI002435570A|nr:FadR/GntR family transcriptional regulator [Bacillus sp. FJAT-47783]
MQYKQIKPKKIYEEVAEALLDMIKKGEIKPGQKLDSIQQLADSFQVGRSAIREALSALRAMGLVEMKQGEGTYVKEFDPVTLTIPLSTAALMNMEDIRNLVEVRKILEVGAAYTAAMKRNQHDLDAMEFALNQMKSNFNDKELGEKADLLFHMAVSTATHNPILISLMSNVSGMMIDSMRETRKIWLYSKDTTNERLYEEHKNIYEAIKNQDAEEAQRLMLAHITEVENVLKKFLNNRQQEGT